LIQFCEYVVLEACRERFLSWAKARPELWQGAELAENAAQRGVFVELRRAADGEEAAAMEKERREGRSWEEMEPWIKGGKQGLRIWTFRPALEPDQRD